MIGRLRELLARVGDFLLERDNYIIGVLICGFAVYDWIGFYDGIESIGLYFSQSIYTLSTLTVLNSFFSALYLTLAAIILLALRPPIARYKTALPNLLAVLAAFIVYLFVLVPGGEVTKVSVYAGLFFVAFGSLIVICALVHLRQAFSVTPQARFLVDGGLYAVVRHPMYIGNIVSIFGVALLVDSLPGYLLFLVCAGLQVCRAFVEERLLRRSLPDYAAYAERVGRFFPRIGFERRTRLAVMIAATMLLTVKPFATGLAGGSPTAPTVGLPSGGHSASTGTNGIIHLAATPTSLVKKCDAWKAKALRDDWFNNADVDAIRDVQVRYVETFGKDNKECEPLIDLLQKCQVFTSRWENGELKDIPFLDKVDGEGGCRSIVGFSNICTALRKVAKRGVTLSDDRRALIAECLQSDVRRKRPDLLRPGM